MHDVWDGGPSFGEEVLRGAPCLPWDKLEQSETPEPNVDVATSLPDHGGLLPLLDGPPCFDIGLLPRGSLPLIT